MVPLLMPGDEILVNNHAYNQRPPAVGDIVVAWHPLKPDFKIVKQVSDVFGMQGVRLIGLNPDESQDSRHFGTVPQSALIGRVICRI